MRSCYGMKKAAIAALIILSILLFSMIAACGKNSSSDSTGGAGGNDAFNEAKNEIKQDDELGDHTGAAKKKLGGISFTIIDGSTIKASINDPYILAKATDMSQVLLRLFPDESARDRKEGAFAFKMCFFEQDDGNVTCNVYPQICRVDKISDYSVQTYEEGIPRPDGGELCGAATVEDTMITFVIQYSGICDIVRNNPVYATYVDYEEYSKGKILSVNEPKKTVPDLSQTSLKDAVKYTYFPDVFPEYFVIEEEYDAYKSYSGHGFAMGVGTYEGQIFWAPTNNSDIKKKSVLIGSVDEFGVANYYMAVVYDSHADLMRDYVADGEVNLTLASGVRSIENAEITDDMLGGFLPENGADIYGSWDYSVDDNVMYWHYLPDFDRHYKPYDDEDKIPRIEYKYAGFGNYELNSKLDEIVREVIENGEAEGEFTYGYMYDDMSYDVKNDTPASSKVHYKGYYHHAPADEAADGAAGANTDAKIKSEADRLKEELESEEQAATDAILNAEREIDPEARCMIFDPDSADFMLMKLDMEMLTSGGMYEMDCGAYTIRVTAKTEDDIKCVIGRYDGESFEEVEAAQGYRDLNSGTPNCIHLNVYLGDIDDVTWPKLAESSFSFYEASSINGGKSSRKLINSAVYAERYDQ